MFSALAENKENISKKINLFIAMSPVARLKHTGNSFLKEIANDIDELAWGFELFHIWSLFGSDWDTISKGICLLKDEWCEKAQEFLQFNRTPLWGDPTIDDQSNKELNIVTTK